MRARALLAAYCGLWLSACSQGSSLLLVVDTSAAGEVEQLYLTGRDGERVVFGPAVRPEHADGLLQPQETLRVLLADELAGRELQVLVEGLHRGQVGAAAQATATVERGREVRVELALERGGATCGECAGCCEGTRCLGPSVAACGVGGVSCFACDPVLSDGCSAQGRCGCGEGPACSPVAGSDRCQAGACRCGEGPPCAAGTGCDNGVCRCTPEACAGCCSGNECLPGTLNASCGAGGAACSACGSGTRCALGSCAPVG